MMVVQRFVSYSLVGMEYCKLENNVTMVILSMGIIVIVVAGRKCVATVF